MLKHETIGYDFAYACITTTCQTDVRHWSARRASECRESLKLCCPLRAGCEECIKSGFHQWLRSCGVALYNLWYYVGASNDAFRPSINCGHRTLT